MAASGSLCVMAAHPFLLLHAASTGARACAAALLLLFAACTPKLIQAAKMAR